MKRIILVSGIIIGCLMLAMIFPVRPALAADKGELMPMELDGTEWVVEVVFVNKKGNKEVSEDTLIFDEKKFTSQSYMDKGYASTNYSLTLDEDDVTKFGTMQIKDKETTFWKGTIKEKTIKGSLHVQRPSGNNITYYYSGKLSNGRLKRKPKPKSVTPPPPPAPVKEKVKENKNIVGEVFEKLIKGKSEEAEVQEEASEPEPSEGEK